MSDTTYPDGAYQLRWPHGGTMPVLVVQHDRESWQRVIGKGLYEPLHIALKDGSTLTPLVPVTALPVGAIESVCGRLMSYIAENPFIPSLDDVETADIATVRAWLDSLETHDNGQQ